MTENFHKVYAYQNSTEILKRSSSGGAYMSLVDAFYKINNGVGHVYGVAFNEKLVPEYQCAKSAVEAAKFCGSKYVYCSCSNVINPIINDLIAGKPVLFIGTPCTVNTILQRTKSLKEKLFTIDLICNGTPDIKVWQQYVLWLNGKYKSKVKSFEFRHKENGNNNPYCSYAEFEDGQKVVDTYLTSSYTQLFLKRLIIRKACFKCPYKNMDRTGDVTIGDFWGIKEAMPDYPQKREVSLVIANTYMGEKLIHNGNNLTALQECDNDIYLKYQDNLRISRACPEQYDKFWEEYDAYGINYVLTRYTNANLIGKVVYPIKKIKRKIFNRG